VRLTVPLPPFWVVSLLIVLLGLPGLAQPGPAPVLPPVGGGEACAPAAVAEVRVAPEQPTTLLFDAALDQGAVEHAARELGFARVAVAKDTLTVVPAPGWRAGERRRLTVPFADGQPPGGLPLVFVLAPTQAEAHVKVSRPPRTLAALEQALAAQQVRCDAKDAELATLREKASSLALLVASGTLGREGLRVVPLETAQWTMPAELERGAASLYVATGQVAFEVELTLAAGAQPWAPGAATLEDQTGQNLVHAGVVQLVDGPVLTAGAKARLVVGFAASMGNLGKLYEFKVTERNGSRGLLLWNLKLVPQPTRKR
jgi:uncharacterized protein (TIGR02268 family)